MLLHTIRSTRVSFQPYYGKRLGATAASAARARERVT